MGIDNFNFRRIIHYGWPQSLEAYYQEACRAGRDGKLADCDSAKACNEMMAYSLILSCCCYTCCVRRKLRKKLNITGGLFDDFLSHLMWCCCALVQEYREVELRGLHGPEKTKRSPPPPQYVES